MSPGPAFPVLFIAPERLDDAVLASGVLRRLLDEAPQARITLIATPEIAPLYRDTPGLERLIYFEPEALGLHWLALWREAQSRRWGLILDQRGCGRFGRLLRARRRAIHKPSPVRVHKVVEAARLLRIEDDPPAPFLFTREETRARAGRLMAPGPKAADGPILAMAPSAEWVGRAWPAERFAVVAAELLGPSGPFRDGRLMLVGPTEGRWAVETVRRTVARERLLDLVGKADPLLTYEALKQARLFIGNEGPWMHLAAAAGAPTLGLFGPSDERVYAPWGPKARVVRGPREFEAFRAADPGFNQAIVHMQDLSTSKVTAAARELMAETTEVPADAGPDAGEQGERDL